MVLLPNSPQEFLGLFAQDIADQPILSSSDLSRISIERHRGESALVREAPSVGNLRLSGMGVKGHQAPLEAVASLGLAFQRLVTSFGAALGGFTSLRGRVPLEFSAKTVLGLGAAPRPGSIILDLTPQLDPIRELRDKGELFNESDTQLIDEVMVELAGLLAAAADHQPGDPASEFTAAIRELGPRTASSLKNFAETTSANGFDLNMRWDQPLHPTTRFELTTRDAIFIAQVIAGRQLDSEQVTLHGTLQTVSHGKKWDLVGSELGDVRIDISELDGRPWSEWNPDDLVEVEAAMTVTHAPGRATARSIKAKKITQWDGTPDEIESDPADSEG